MLNFKENLSTRIALRILEKRNRGTLQDLEEYPLTQKFLRGMKIESRQKNKNRESQHN